MEKFTSVKQVLVEMANRRTARTEAAEMDKEQPQEPRWCNTCQRNVTTPEQPGATLLGILDRPGLAAPPINHLAMFHHIDGMTICEFSVHRLHALAIGRCVWCEAEARQKAHV